MFVTNKTKAEELIRNGAECIPTQWIELDRAERFRVPDGPEVQPDFKSRLVSRGDLEECIARSDSPTTSETGVCIVFSFASSKG